MRILICGGRDFRDRYPMELLMTGFPEGTVIIEGGARGADLMAREIAEECGHEVVEYPANWEKHHKAAGPIRNKQMIDEGQPDVVFAFTEKPLTETRGTANMVKQARKAGLPVYVIGCPPSPVDIPPKRTDMPGFKVYG